MPVVSLSLKDLELRNQYHSDRHNLLENFYIPCLERSLTYDQAIGFFLSISLVAKAKGVSAPRVELGRMQLIASLHWSQEGADAIAQRLKQRKSVKAALVRELQQLKLKQVKRHSRQRELLTNMGILDKKALLSLGFPWLRRAWLLDESN